MVTTGALLHGDVAAPSRLRSGRAAGRAAARRQRAGRPGGLRAARRALGLRRDQPQLRLPERARAARRLRRLPDGRAGAGRRLRAGDARRGRACRSPSSTGSASTASRATPSCATSSAPSPTAAARCSSSMRATPGCTASARRRTASCRRCATRSSPRSSRTSRRSTFVAQRRHPQRRRRSSEHLGTVDGVMVGRAAYHHPWDLADWDARFFGAPGPSAVARRGRGRDGRLHGAPASRPASRGRTRRATCSALRNGQPGARRWRQVWSRSRG